MPTNHLPEKESCNHMSCCFGQKENRDLTQSLLGDPQNATKVESNAILGSIREINESVFKKHTEYLVQIHATGANISSCWKRYSDFEALYLGMSQNQPQMLANFSVVLPPKNISNSKEAKEERRQHLQEFLRRVVSSATLLWSNDMQQFVGCEPGIVEQLNASSTEQQQRIKALWKTKLRVMTLLAMQRQFHILIFIDAAFTFSSR
jgi:hypothetical protein